MATSGSLYGEVHFDSGEIERWGQLLEEAAVELDTGAERRKPQYIDAGPLTPVVEDMVEATVAQYVHLILRLEAAAHRLNKVAKAYREIEKKNQELIEQGKFHLIEIGFAHSWFEHGPEIREAWESVDKKRTR
ncbi:hypothetical protein [Thermasporomyces composti]|uniref:hypothetical protein n=1 Tax=Thermasporomyces composti TaxID=696763 RepID=UPI0011C0452C|nr:hypothetical protein [Thermasporomyces composti]